MASSHDCCCSACRTGPVTITVAVGVVDSLVFASDSATTQQATMPDGHADTINIWNSANKIFNLRKSWPVGG